MQWSNEKDISKFNEIDNILNIQFTIVRVSLFDLNIFFMICIKILYIEKVIYICEYFFCF